MYRHRLFNMCAKGINKEESKADNCKAKGWAKHDNRNSTTNHFAPSLFYYTGHLFYLDLTMHIEMPHLQRPASEHVSPPLDPIPAD